MVDARATRIDTEQAWDLLKEAVSITTVKGKKVQHWNPQSDDKTTILQQVIGPSGNLRAPTLRVRETFIVGFNAELYDTWLSNK